MTMKMDWIPDPQEWQDVGFQTTKDNDVNRLNDVVEKATGKPLVHNQEVVLSKQHLPFFAGASAAGLYVAASVVKAIETHGHIRLRYRRL